MLKTKPLNALLAQSLSNHVSEAILFTSSGSLVATAASPSISGPIARQAQTHAALAANIWSNYESVSSQNAISQALPSTEAASRPPAASPQPPSSSQEDQSKSSAKSQLAAPRAVKSITVELSDHNLHIQTVTPVILLALVGPKQPTLHTSSNSSQHSLEAMAEADNSIPKGSGSKSGSILSANVGAISVMSASAASGGGALGVLKLTAQTLVDFLEKELKDFEPPDNV